MINPKIFLGDAAFDSIQIYRDILLDLEFDKAYIFLKTSLTLENADCPLNEGGILCCPRDFSHPMKREGSKPHLRSRIPTMKFICSKMKWLYDKETKKSKRVTQCENPCINSSC